MKLIKQYALVFIGLTLFTSCNKDDDKPADNIIPQPQIYGIVTTLAGSGVAGASNGTGAAAKFNTPQQVSVDSNGDILIADFANHSIRKITQAGVVTTIAGSTGGWVDDDAAIAQFYFPMGICVNSGGDILIADAGNNRIRKLSAGYVSTLAGSNVGFADGTGSLAEFSAPSQMCVDSNGNIYVADFDNNKIRKITAAGVVTTFAGSTSGDSDGLGSAAQFSGPAGVCIDSQGMLYVVDYYNNKIRKISPGGEVTTVAGGASGYTDGAANTAQFYFPCGITVDPLGNLYVADRNNHKIRKITPAGMVSTIAGSTDGHNDATGTAAQFSSPTAIYFHNWKLYVSDKHSIRVIQ